MAYNRKHFHGATPPRRCDALVVVEGLNPVQCRNKVHKAGMCIEHWSDWVKQKEVRGREATVHKLGVDENGKTIYNPPLPSNWCHEINCRRVALIKAEGLQWCGKHFQKEQDRRREVEK